jgi:hypothetical protein
MSEKNNIGPGPAVEALEHRWTVRGFEIKTGLRYPRSIFIKHLDELGVEAIVRAAERLGDPTAEQWLGLRAGAAERRLRTCAELAEGLEQIWPEGRSSSVELGERRLLDVLVYLVEDRLLKGQNFDYGQKQWDLQNRVATFVLSCEPLVSRDATEPDRAARVLAARLTGQTHRRLMLPIGIPIPGKNDKETTRVEDQMVIGQLAVTLAARDDASSRRMAQFLGRPELWSLTVKEQAEALEITYDNWRTDMSRVRSHLRDWSYDG